MVSVVVGVHRQFTIVTISLSTQVYQSAFSAVEDGLESVECDDRHSLTVVMLFAIVG